MDEGTEVEREIGGKRTKGKRMNGTNMEISFMGWSGLLNYGWGRFERVSAKQNMFVLKCEERTLSLQRNI